MSVAGAGTNIGIPPLLAKISGIGVSSLHLVVVLILTLKGESLPERLHVLEGIFLHALAQGLGDSLLTTTNAMVFFHDEEIKLTYAVFFFRNGDRH